MMRVERNVCTVRLHGGFHSGTNLTTDYWCLLKSYFLLQNNTWSEWESNQTMSLEVLVEIACMLFSKQIKLWILILVWFTDKWISYGSFGCSGKFSEVKLERRMNNDKGPGTHKNRGHHEKGLWPLTECNKSACASVSSEQVAAW